MGALHFDHALVAGEWARDVRITLGAGAIAAIEVGARLQPGDELHGVALPGLANAHSHAFQRAMAGRTEFRSSTRDSFWTWREALYATALRLTPDDIEAVAAYAQVEMLESGFTRVGEFHYLHHAEDGSSYADVAETAVRIAAAASASGIRLTLLPVFYAHAGFGGLAPRPEQRRFVCDADTFAALVDGARRAIAGLPGATLGIAPHSLRAVTPGELRSLLDAWPAGPVHIHAAEQPREVAECRAALGLPPVAWLLEAFGIDARWTVVHATHASAGELRGLADRGVVACICPLTESNLGDGIFRAAPFLERSGRLAVGSDSNVVIDAAGELRLLEYTQRLAEGARNVLGSAAAGTGRELVAQVRRGGQQALAAPIAGLEPGAPADLFTLPADLVDESGDEPDTALNLWIFGSRRSGTDAVWVDGRRLVVDGRHVDREPLRRRFLAVLRRLASA